MEECSKYAHVAILSTIGELVNKQMEAKPRTKKNTILEKLILPRFFITMLEKHLPENGDPHPEIFLLSQKCINDTLSRNAC